MVKQGMTQTRLASELGVSLATVSRVRSQDRNPTLDLMSRISRVYGWSIGDQATAWEAGKWLHGFEDLIQRLGSGDLEMEVCDECGEKTPVRHGTDGDATLRCGACHEAALWDR